MKDLTGTVDSSFYFVAIIFSSFQKTEQNILFVIFSPPSKKSQNVLFSAKFFAFVFDSSFPQKILLLHFS